MSSLPPRILLANLKDADIAAEIPFLFHQAEVPFDVYCSERSWLLKSRYRTGWHPADTFSPRAYAEELSRLVASHGYDWVVFMDDFALRAAHDYLDEHTARKILPITNFAHKALTSSKAALSVLSRRYGLTTPRFAVHDGRRDIVHDARSVPFPLLLKVDRSGGGKGVFFCGDEASLVDTYASIPDEWRKQLLIQEYIDGENISVEAFYHNGTLVAHSRARVLENVKGEFSISCVREYCPHEGFVGELERIGLVLGLNGFCSFTFMYDMDQDTHYLVEADLRTHGWFVLARFAGVNFADAIRSRIYGTPLVLKPEKLVIRHFSRDVVRSVRTRNFRNVWAWARNKDDRWRFVPTHDRHLLAAVFMQMGREVLFSFTFLRPLGHAAARLWRGVIRWKERIRHPADIAHLKLFFEYLNKEKSSVGVSVLLAALQMALLVPIPFFIKSGFDAIVLEKDIKLLLLSLCWATLFLIAGTTIMLAQSYVTLRTTKSIIATMRERLLAHMLLLDHAFYATKDLDDMHTKIVQDTERLDRVANKLLAQVLPALLVAISFSFVLFYLNPLLFVIIIAFVPILYLFGKRMGAKVKTSIQRFHIDFSSFSTGVSFVLKFHELISISGAAEGELKRQKERVRALKHSSAYMAWLSTVYTALQSNVLVVCGAVVLVIGGLQTVQGLVTVGAVLSFYVALTIGARNARRVFSSMPTLIEGDESLRSLAPYLKQVAGFDAKEEDNFGYPIEFRKVSFGYGEDPVLRNVSFHIPEHAVTGIFGASGSGKTTLVRLLLGLYAPTHGEVIVAGRDLQTFHLPSFRRLVGVLTQDPLFFPGTIQENLCYGLDVDWESMIATCSLCRIHDTIMRLPDGYDSVLGHRGVTLSGGEKQRMAIARALLRKPHLLILDEPDNNLDDAIIGEILRDAKALGHTIILISHNQSLRTLVDHTLLVSEGTVIQEDVTQSIPQYFTKILEMSRVE